jgi:hypothetical protein
MERDALICFNIAHDNYDLNGQVSETFVSGKTSDISTIAEFGWYEWV